MRQGFALKAAIGGVVVAVLGGGMWLSRGGGHYVGGVCAYQSSPQVLQERCTRDNIACAQYRLKKGESDDLDA